MNSSTEKAHADISGDRWRTACGADRVRPAKTVVRLLLRTADYLALAFVTAIFLVPLLWMLGSSFRTQAEIFQYSYPLSIKTFVPQQAILENYRSIFVDREFGRFLWNSLIVAIAMVALSWYVNSAAAFAISRMRFRGKNAIYLIIVSTMLVPLEATIVPTYLVARSLRMEDTLVALVIPWVAEPFAIFLLKQVIDEIPRDLDDAAKVDGASPLQIYRSVVLPNIYPAQVTVAIMKFLWAWSGFFWPLVVINSKENMVLPVAIATLFTQSQTFWGEIFAAATVAVVPVAVVFIFLQRYYIRGIVMSGFK